MAGRRGTRKTELADEARRLLTDIMFQYRDRFLSLARELGLSPGDVGALMSLDPDQPASMRRLAEGLKCDASMVTWLVDRLEERGLVERHTSRTDRRVKTLALTDKGVALRKKIEAHLYVPSAGLDVLTVDELHGLTRALRKLRDAGRAGK